MGMESDPDTLTRNPSKKGLFSGTFFNRQATVERKQPSPRENSLRTSNSLETRRPLKTVELSPPSYKVEQDILIQSYIELPIKYLGVITKVPFALDATNRTDLLRYVDQSRKHHKLPWKTHGREHDAILSLSVRQIKLLKRDGEELLQRFQIHNVAVLSYVRDDDQHILAFKTSMADGPGSVETCNLVILECENKDKAEEICSLTNQIFDLVYQELTLRFFNRELDNAVCDLRSSNGSSTNTDGSQVTVRPFTPRRGPGTSTDELSTTAKVLLQEYIEVLRKQLNSDELQQFAAILREYRQTGSITEFCTRLQQLYGPGRTNLFPGMRPYIPEKDIDFFESFLERHGLHDQGNGIYGYGGPPGGARRSQRTPSEASTSSTMAADMGPYSHSIPSEMDELDRALLDVCNEVEHLETTIDS